MRESQLARARLLEQNINESGDGFPVVGLKASKIFLPYSQMHTSSRTPKSKKSACYNRGTSRDGEIHVTTF